LLAGIWLNNKNEEAVSAVFILTEMRNTYIGDAGFEPWVRVILNLERVEMASPEDDDLSRIWMASAGPRSAGIVIRFRFDALTDYLSAVKVQWDTLIS
jgi:hypothetical protein